MIYKRLYISLIIHIIIICAWSSGFGFSIVAGDYFYVTICLSGLIVSAFSLLYRINRTNRKLEQFFSSVKTKDSSIVFPKESDLLNENKLNESLNSMGNIIKDLSFSLEVQKGFLNTVMGKVKTGILSFGTDERVDFANQAILDLFNLPALNHLKQLDQVSPNLRQKFLALKRSDQEQINLKINQLPSTLLVQCEQITTSERKSTILSIQNIKSELDQKEIESWQKLIRMINHEITNALVPITSISSALHEELSQPTHLKTTENLNQQSIERLTQGISLIQEHSNGLLRFVDSYRSLTRIPNPVIKEIPLDEFFERIILLSKGYISQQKHHTSIKFSTRVKPIKLLLRADEDQMGQVLLNLVKNAIESLQPDNPDPKISLDAMLVHGQTRIIVTDNGQGIPKDQIDQIFIPFFTTKPMGSGIGLPLSRQILKLHGGEIFASSVHGTMKSGTNFTLTFNNSAKN